MTQRYPVPLSDVLVAAAGVLQEMEGRCAELQEALSPAMTAGARPMALQDLDYVTQGLASLSYFLASLSERLPREWAADALAVAEALPLEDVAAALSLAPVPVRAGAGELELFE
ncbi:hypothetical protein ACO2Q0_07745 [Phenylobacterium sp. VNQ135]|uniref:hypothetical protein n=1 Tax=Phenylobacterium sp. VNQ135 TaxID=3400922 RepID=UPI003BFC593C